MAYIDQDYYTASYFGEEIPDSDFNKLAEKASLIIDAVTHGRAKIVTEQDSDPEKISAIKTATAIQTEYMYAQGGVSSYTGTGDNLKTSESIGNYSYSRNIDGSYSFGGIPISPLALAVLDSQSLRYAGI